MIKYSWKKINDKFGWNAQNVLTYFFIQQNIKVPSYLKVSSIVSKVATQPYIPGPCYLINPDEALLKAPGPNYLYNYIEIASKRNLFDYKIRGVSYLQIELVEEYLLGLVETNPMLTIENSKIYFKYEQE